MVLERITEALMLCQKGVAENDLGGQVKLNGAKCSYTMRYCKFPEFGCKNLVYPSAKADGSGKEYYLCKRDVHEQ